MTTNGDESSTETETRLLQRIDMLESRLSALEGAWQLLAARQGETPESSAATLDQLLRGIPENLRPGVLSRDQWFLAPGTLISSADLSPEQKGMAYHQYDHLEKSEIALTVASSLAYGDYFEFGAATLATFRNMLTAYDLAGLRPRHAGEGRNEARFYAFDIFGDVDVEKMKSVGIDTIETYFRHFDTDANSLEHHQKLLDEHRLFVDQCHLVQGLFEETLNDEFKQQYLAEQREIGFAFVDCNITPSYKVVFEFLFDLISAQGFIYMDEFFQNVDGCPTYFTEFTDRLREERQIGCMYVRNAGGYGALFRFHPLVRERIHEQYGPLRIGKNQGT